MPFGITVSLFFPIQWLSYCIHVYQPDTEVSIGCFYFSYYQYPTQYFEYYLLYGNMVMYVNINLHEYA